MPPSPVDKQRCTGVHRPPHLCARGGVSGIPDQGKDIWHRVLRINGIKGIGAPDPEQEVDPKDPYPEMPLLQTAFRSAIASFISSHLKRPTPPVANSSYSYLHSICFRRFAPYLTYVFIHHKTSTCAYNAHCQSFNRVYDVAPSAISRAPLGARSLLF